VKLTVAHFLILHKGIFETQQKATLLHTHCGTNRDIHTAHTYIDTQRHTYTHTHTHLHILKTYVHTQRHRHILNTHGKILTNTHYV
jgi:hypothetical protein